MQPINNTKAVGPKSTALDVLRLFWQGMKPYRYGYYFAVLGVAAVAVIQVYTPLYYKRFFDVITKATDRGAIAPTLVHIILIVLVLNIINWILFRGATFIQNNIQAKIMARLRQNAFEYMMKHSYTFFANNFTGSLTQRVNRFARAFDVLSDRFLWSITPLAVGVTGIIIVLWKVNPLISIIIIVWAATLFIFNFFFSRWKVKYDIIAAATDSKSTGVLSDAITNQNAIQLFTGYNYEVQGYRDITNEQARATTFTWNLAGTVEAVQSSLIFIAEFLLFYFSIKLWIAGSITVGTFVLIQAYFIGLGGRLWELSRIVRNIYEGFADAKEMADIILEKHEIKDLPGATALTVSKGEIKFDHLSFSFNEARSVLKDINLTINAGEKVALIGPSGAGKSTFVRLILRLYESGSGKILIDNQDIKHVTQESLRSSIAFVPQDPVLFHRSLMENIRYGRPDATDEEVLRAAKLAHCDEFIDDLPLKYETFVGERGIKLSGGERQRVAIARALLKNAPILILDEATSSLDSHSESLIQDALDTLMKGRTTIVIAHRLSTIRKMDRIIVIEAGEIKEEGTHDTLLERENGIYKKLWTLQAGGFLQEAPDEEASSE